MICVSPATVIRAPCLSRLCSATRSLFEAVLNQRSSSSPRVAASSSRRGDVVEAPVAWADAMQRLLLLIGEMVAGGSDRVLLPAVAVQPRAGRL